jgi:hypothetical protein
MSYTKLSLSVLAMLLVLVMPAAAQQATPTLAPPLTIPDTFDSQLDPAALVGSYYNAISRGEYQRAYNYWESAPNNQTEAQFAAGFSDTFGATAIVRLPIVTGVGAGNEYASMPTLVIGTRLNGTTVIYTGCFVAHKVNVPVGNATQPDPNWRLQTGNLRQQTSLNLGALDTACDNSLSLASNLNALSQFDPSLLVKSYYSAISQGLYSVAYSYWENAPNNQTEAQFAAGFADTVSVSTYIGLPIHSDAGAGNIYASIPTLVIAGRSNGTTAYFAGCFTAHKVNVPVGNATEPNPNWYLRDGNLRQVFSAVEGVNVVLEGCGAQG